jgi:hypothetical protein
MSVTEIVSELEHNRFYGSLEIKFEAGRVVLVKKTETIKATGEGAGRNCRDNRGIDNDRDS